MSSFVYIMNEFLRVAVNTPIHCHQSVNRLFTQQFITKCMCNYMNNLYDKFWFYPGICATVIKSSRQVLSVKTKKPLLIKRLLIRTSKVKNVFKPTPNRLLAMQVFLYYR